MKRSILILSLVLALSLVFVGSAFANFGPHGGYATDTDSCAACHRAHSSFSSIQFTPKVATGPTSDYPYALLVGNAATIQQFCYACHGDMAPGAATNVQSGLFDSGPSGDTTHGVGTNSQTLTGDGGSVVVSYETSSTFGAPLNGGGFGTSNGTILDTATWEDSGTLAYQPVTSVHSMEATGVLWGGGNSLKELAGFTCTNCHDPHGSSNYRLLRDGVNNVADNTGGYVGGVPQAAVMSVETGYPNGLGGTSTGWLLGNAGADQMKDYRPNYTSGSSEIKAATLGGNGSLSSWCAGCHTAYDQNSGTANYTLGTTNYEDGVISGGSATRHRHPVDIPLTAGDSVLQIKAQDNGPLDKRIPTEVNPLLAGRNGQNVGCLTCHFAHGTTATMSGWSNAHLTTNASGTVAPERDATAGVSPDKVADLVGTGAGWPDQFSTAAVNRGTTTLLRADNRGVCERCHNK